MKYKEKFEKTYIEMKIRKIFGGVPAFILIFCFGKSSPRSFDSRGYGLFLIPLKRNRKKESVATDSFSFCSERR